MREYPNQRELYEQYHKRITEMYPDRQALRQNEIAEFLGIIPKTVYLRYGIRNVTDITAVAMRLARVEAKAEYELLGE